MLTSAFYYINKGLPSLLTAPPTAVLEYQRHLCSNHIRHMCFSCELLNSSTQMVCLCNTLCHDYVRACVRWLRNDNCLEMHAVNKPANKMNHEERRRHFVDYIFWEIRHRHFGSEGARYITLPVFSCTRL